MHSKTPKSCVKKAYTLWHFFKNHASGPNALIWINLAFLLELILFLPLDLLLIFYFLKNRSETHSNFIQASYVSVSAATSSTLSSIVGYFLGSFAWKNIGSKIVFKFFSEKSVNWLISFYHAKQNFVLFFGGLLPVPFKVITISAGFCKIPILTFIITIFISRIARFSIISFFTVTYGKKITMILQKYFYKAVLFAGLTIIYLF